MSDTDNSESNDKSESILDKAKAAAADIDVKEIAGKAKAAAAEIDVKEIAGKAKDAAVVAKDKVTTFVGEHEDQIGSAIEKTGQFVDDKLTKKKFSDKIDKAQEAAKSAVSKVGQTGDTGDTGDDEAGGSADPDEPKG